MNAPVEPLQIGDSVKFSCIEDALEFFESSASCWDQRMVATV